MHLQLVLLIFSIFANLTLGALVLLRTYRRLYGWLFASTVFEVALWALGDLLLLSTKNANHLHAYEVLFYVVPMLAPVTILLFSIIFTEYESKKLNPGLVAVILIPLLLGAGVILSDPGLIVSHLEIPKNGLNSPVPMLPGFLFYAAHFVVYFSAAYAVLFFRLRRAKGLTQIQLSYTLSGVMVASMPALVSNLALPIFHVYHTIWLGPIFTLVFVAAVSLTIVKHRLFDIHFVFVRLVAYTGSLAVLAAIYGFMVFGVANVMFNLHFRIVTQVFLSVTTAIAALLFGRIRNFFDRITNKYFYQDAYNPQEFIDSLNRAFVTDLEIDRLLKDSSHIIAKNLKAEYCMIGVRETAFRGMHVSGTTKQDFTIEEIKLARSITPKLGTSIIVADYLPPEQRKLKEILDRKGIAILARLTPSATSKEEGLGYIILGRKKSGNPYNSEDIRIIDTITKELLIAIQNSLHFEEIQNFNITLQAKVRSATRELRRTNEKLRELDEAKNDFISMASHQLRTPLTSVKGYISMVLEGDAGQLNSSQRKMLTQAFGSSQRMVYLIADLLNVSRLKTGKFLLDKIETNLADVVEEEVSQLVDTAASREVELTYKKSPGFPILILDETKTRQVIMNFIDNAIYYTPSGGHIKVEIANKPTTVELRVIDDGLGVPKADQHHLFTKFYRAGNARKARPDGTGLGLFMAKKVIVAQGGSIIFESVEGKGSTFGFAFPKVRLMPPPAEPIAEKALV